MWILNQERNRLYQIEKIKTISVDQYSDELYSITIDSNFGSGQYVGFFNTLKAAEDVFSLLMDWLSSPYLNGRNANIFTMPDDESEPPRVQEEKHSSGFSGTIKKLC